MDEDVAILSPQLTGLPFAVSVHQREVRVAAPPDHDGQALQRWIALNEQVLQAHWLGDLPYTENLLAALRPV